MNNATKVVFFKDFNKFEESLSYFDIKDFSEKKVPVKLHMGEIKNKYFLKSDFVKQVITVLKEHKITPFLFDTTVAYPGLRHYKKGYHKVAKIHGFTEKKIGCNVVIDDSGKKININDYDYEVADTLADSTHIFALSHLKGHIACGMGGAIKNFGMGGVTKETKIGIHHDSRPVFQKDKCTYCGKCAEVCPFKAIEVSENSWNQKMRKCFGCGVCVDTCTTGALVNKKADFQYMLACACQACVQDKKVIYLNEVKRISKGCDCDPFSGPIICPDIGYFVSDDPVSVDKASLDQIHKIKPGLFKKINHVDPLKQIIYGEKIGLGNSKYELVEL